MSSILLNLPQEVSTIIIGILFFGGIYFIIGGLSNWDFFWRQVTLSKRVGRICVPLFGLAICIVASWLYNDVVEQQAIKKAKVPVNKNLYVVSQASSKNMDTTTKKEENNQNINQYVKIINVNPSVDNKGWITIEMNIEFLADMIVEKDRFVLQKPGTNTVRAVNGYFKDKNGSTEYVKGFKGDRYYTRIRFRTEPGETLNGYTLCFVYGGTPTPIYSF